MTFYPPDISHITNPHMLPKVRSKTITDFAAGQPCELRIGTFLGRPCWDNSTCVWCHLGNLGKGVSTKVCDVFGAIGCLGCHDITDGRDMRSLEQIAERYPLALGQQILQAQQASWSRLIHAGLIVVKGATII